MASRWQHSPKQGSGALLNYIPLGGKPRPPLCPLTESTFKKMQMEWDLGVLCVTVIPALEKLKREFRVTQIVSLPSSSNPWATVSRLGLSP